MKSEDQWFLDKLELDYGDKGALNRLKKLAGEIDWLLGWPSNKRAFWNGEAFMWRNKIDKRKRGIIEKELSFLEGKKNLDLGCGAYSYVTSTGFDISEKMLQLNEELISYVVGDLEEKLPLKDSSFSAVTMVFVLNYVLDYWNLLKEVSRVLKKRGQLVVVQSAQEVNEWQRQKVVQRMNFSRWQEVLEKVGFSVKFYEKEGLGFFKCVKSK